MAMSLFSAVCYGIAAVLQSVAARATRDVRRGVDPLLLLRLLGDWRFLCGLALNVVGLAAQIGALRSLPLYLAQATQSAIIPVTAVVATRWLGMRMRRSEWLAVALVCAGLSLLGFASVGAGAGHASSAFHWELLVAVLLLSLLGLAAGRLPNTSRSALLGLISGVGFGAVGVGIRVLPDLGLPTMALDPATYAVVLAGVVASWLYACALQRGRVVAATAMMLVGQLAPPAVIGVLVLGDQARPGWTPVAFAGFVTALSGGLALARFGDIKVPAPDPA